MKIAKKKNIITSYDSNFRAKLWTAEQCGEFLKEVLNYIDIGFLGDLDITKLLNFESNFTGDYIDYLKELYAKLNKMYPNIKYIASTKREIESANINLLTGYIYMNGEIKSSPKYKFDILDRVGGGDAFSAGVLHGIIRNKNLDDIINFATVASIFKHSYKGDINYCVEEDIEMFIKNGILAIGR